jgi:FkbM family methyltransferase
MLASRINALLIKLFKVKIVRFRPSFDLARASILFNSGINLVIDGGANRGQWAAQVKKQSHDLPIISVEPINSPFLELSELAATHHNWAAINAALGDKIGSAVMNVANNGEQSSSLLTPSQHLDFYPTVRFQETQYVQIITLDSIEINVDSQIYLKLDLQGNELAALKGAVELLTKVVAIEIEMTTDQMYEGQAPFLEVVTYLGQHDFHLYSFAEPFRNHKGRSMYFDAIFKKEPFVEIDNEA